MQTIKLLWQDHDQHFLQQNKCQRYFHFKEVFELYVDLAKFIIIL